MADFCWLAEDVANRPTQIYELVLLQPTVDGYHDASGYMCGDMVLPGPIAIPRIFRCSLVLCGHNQTPTGLTP